jgi:hypothetical protein
VNSHGVLQWLSANVAAGVLQLAEMAEKGGEE